MIDTWKKRREDEEEYIPGAFGAARIGAQALAQRQSRPATPTVSYTAPKTTQQRYADIDSRIADYTYQKFVESDDYASLVKRYSKQGLRAMDDTLGRVAARTGGIASSYATTAGQQAYGGYMSELEGIARVMYDAEKGAMMDERERLYNMQRQERSDALDLYKLRVAADEDKYNRDRAEEQEDYDRKTAMAKILAGYGDFSLYEELGLNSSQIGNMKAAYDKANTPAAAEQKPKLTAAQANAAIKEGITTPEVIAAYEYYYGAGALGNNGTLLAGDNTGDGGEPLLDNSGNPVTANDGKTPLTTEDEALYKKVWDAVMSVDKSAVRDRYSGALLSPSQWAAEPQGYRDYKEYLTDFVREFVPDFEGFGGTQQAQNGSETYGVDEYLRTISDLYNSEGVDAVMDEFTSILDEKPEDLTYDEWEKVLNYLKTLR